MLASFTNLSYRSMLNMQKELGTVLVRPSTAPDGSGSRAGSPPGQHPPLLLHRIAPAPGSVLAPGVMQGATLAVSVLLLAALLIALASREIARPEWDLEWLATLPMPLFTLLASRLIERVVTNSSGFLTLAPFLSVLAWFCGYRWGAPLVGVAITLALLVVVATVQIMVDTGLRLSLPPHRLRNFHALISIVSLPVLFLVLSMALTDNTFMFDVARLLPDWTRWLPSGLAVAALASADPGTAAVWSALMVAEILVVTAVGFAGLARQLRQRCRLGRDTRSGRPPAAETARAHRSRTWRTRVRADLAGTAPRASLAGTRPHIHGADPRAASGDRGHADPA